jgi:hypothetical protein
MPGSTGSTSEQPVVSVDINPTGGSSLVLQVFFLAVVPVVPVVTGSTDVSLVVPVGQFPQNSSSL